MADFKEKCRRFIIYFALGLVIGLLLGPLAHALLVIILKWMGQKPL